ncbi:MAG TPA: hypothetical protein VG737_08390, partial [Cyclobacteriaceae bacterium]|nr:hypothetical protein [Cyclobacteriaceae bacterium]
ASYGILLLQNRLWKKESLSKLILAGATAFFSIWAMVGSGQETVYWGFIAIVSGIPFYVWMKRAQ